MLAGHYAAALIAKKYAPQRSLGTGFVAAQFQDILWAGAILLGIEHARIIPNFLPASPYDLYDFPWTHSLLLAIVWAVLFGLVMRSVVFALCSFSHWVLDFVAQWHDLPVLFEKAHLGLGLWRSQAATFLTESGLLVIGLVVYLHATRPLRKAGSYAVPVVVAILIAIGGMNTFGMAPKSITLTALMAEASYIGFALVAHWVDRWRTARGPESTVQAPNRFARGSEDCQLDGAVNNG